MRQPFRAIELRRWKEARGEPADAVLRKQFVTEVKAEGEDDLTLQFIISTGAVDRDGDTIDPNGWDLSNFLKNPVMLWAHDYSAPPVAQALATWVEDGKLKSRAKFTPRDLSAFGYMVYRMYREGFLRATSVGFVPKEWVFNEERAGWAPIDFKKQELLEYSGVPVPSNPEALLEAKSKGIDTGPLLEWAEQVLDGAHGESGLWVPRSAVEGIVKVLDTRKTIPAPGAKDGPPEPDDPKEGTDKAGAGDEPEKEAETKEPEDPRLSATVHLITLTDRDLEAVIEEAVKRALEAQQRAQADDEEPDEPDELLIELADDEPEDVIELAGDDLGRTIGDVLHAELSELRTALTGRLD